MLLTYVDESYCKECYYIAALVCPETEVRSLTSALNDVMTHAVSSYGEHLDPSAELHGHDIFQAKNHWAGMKPLLRARIGVYNQALRAIGAHDVRIIIRGVLPEGLRKRYGSNAFHPHSVALTQLLERVDTYATVRGQLSLIIADEPGQKDQQPEYRADLRKFQTRGTWGYLGKQLTRIVDTLHFAPSSESRLLQAADLISFLYHRIVTTSATANPRATRANDALWEQVANKVWHAHCWDP